ncbi:Methylenetetrahydrofolate reductase 1 [Tetrabaena socialis]|uniref:Methylenetetrahydrofolate reductase 1 n=1 Tax=Tetrabaena socialis TaxID=47790 RepID=A0A2J7ZV84_9CHLO|nr:Methylenetetrahydrofolate reductase 1 [Tetrabaena socialis]|eukprot:PNH04186.1 Methylenetetrahydrofolate reductase 1 [Tetrabaena socialis]
MKLIDKVNQKLKEGKTFFSFEFFPPRTEERRPHPNTSDDTQGVENLFERLDRMVTYGPVFCDITWGAGGTTADVTLDIATRMQNQAGAAPTLDAERAAGVPVVVKVDFEEEHVRLLGDHAADLRAPACKRTFGKSARHALHHLRSDYVYGKSYVEFFCSPESWESLRPRLDAAPSLTYLATTAAGAPSGNMGPDDVNALSWGVFPGKEVLQPTVVCAASFGVWKEEAFELWLSEWGSLYEEGSASRGVLSAIAESWVLVSVVDNDYVSGDLFAVLLG